MTNKKASFLTIAFKLWTSDLGDMEDYMTCLEALMLKYSVSFLEEEDCDVERSSITELLSVEDLFIFHLNCEAYNNYKAFELFCADYMNFSRMDRPTSLHSFLNLN